MSAGGRYSRVSDRGKSAHGSGITAIKSTIRNGLSLFVFGGCMSLVPGLLFGGLHCGCGLYRFPI